MIEQMHRAAQYLAAAGISFLDREEDDGHTNLGFSIKEGSMYSRAFNDAGDTLSLNYKNFTLEWNANSSSTLFRLDGRIHTEVIQWISHTAVQAKIKAPYRYALHYEIPYQITDDFTFRLSDISRLQELVHLRIQVQLALETFLRKNGLKSEIRIWPHHFDTAAFASLGDGTGRAVGLGLALPDIVCDDHYYYISVYEGNYGIDTSHFAPLTHGEWHNEGFKGAYLPATGINETMNVDFYQEALETYK